MQRLGVAKIYGKDINSFLPKLQQQGVEAYEIGFAYGVDEKIPNETIAIAKNCGIKLSGHIPFFISWVNEEKRLNSIKHFIKGMSFAARLETIAVCHMGYYGDKSFEQLKGQVISGIKEALNQVKQNFDIKKPVLGLETTGKKAEIGTLDEVILITKELPEYVIPIIDWAHLFARSNGKFLRNVDNFYQVLCQLEIETNLKEFYFHVSGIEYKDGNERKHQSIKSCQPPLPYLFHVLNKAGYDYTAIIESPEAIDDLKWLKQMSKEPEQWFDFAENALSGISPKETPPKSNHQTKLKF